MSIVSCVSLNSRLLSVSIILFKHILVFVRVFYTKYSRKPTLIHAIQNTRDLNIGWMFDWIYPVIWIACMQQWCFQERKIFRLRTDFLDASKYNTRLTSKQIKHMKKISLNILFVRRLFLTNTLQKRQIVDAVSDSIPAHMLPRHIGNKPREYKGARYTSKDAGYQHSSGKHASRLSMLWWYGLWCIHHAQRAANRINQV